MLSTSGSTGGPDRRGLSVLEDFRSPDQTSLAANATEGEVASPNGCGSVPVDVQFHSEVSGGEAPYSYVWSFGDGTPNATQPDPDHAYAEYGTYAVKLGVTDASGARASANLTVDLYPPPCPIQENNILPVPFGLLFGVAVLGILAVGLGVYLYSRRRPPAP